MYRLIFLLIAAIGLIPGLLVLIPAVDSEFDKPDVPAGPGTQGTPLLWTHRIEFQSFGLTVTLYPRRWKTICLGVGLALYAIGLTAMFVRPPGD